VEPDLRPRFKLPPCSKDSQQKEQLLRRARLPWPHMQRIEYPSLAEVPMGFQELCSLVPLEDEFIDILRNIENFCIVFREVHRSGKIKTLRATDFDVTSLRYRLLCMESARRSATHKELVGDASIRMVGYITRRARKATCNCSREAQGLSYEIRFQCGCSRDRMPRVFVVVDMYGRLATTAIY
jgi:hypothetical protein